MSDHDSDTRQDLAAEFVLGTLTGRARRDYRRQMQGDVDERARVHAWERRLENLYRLLPDRRPTERVWLGILARIRAHRRHAAEPRPGLWQRWPLPVPPVWWRYCC